MGSCGGCDCSYRKQGKLCKRAQEMSERGAIWGTVAGFGVGLVLGGPVGAFFGALLGGKLGYEWGKEAARQHRNCKCRE